MLLFIEIANRHYSNVIPYFCLVVNTCECVKLCTCQVWAVCCILSVILNSKPIICCRLSTVDDKLNNKKIIVQLDTFSTNLHQRDKIEKSQSVWTFFELVLLRPGIKFLNKNPILTRGVALPSHRKMFVGITLMENKLEFNGNVDGFPSMTFSVWRDGLVWQRRKI